MKMNKKREIVVKSPLFIDIPRKTKKDKRVRLNLNVYRNLNKFTESDTKKLYNTIISKQLKKYKNINFKKIEIEFTMYKIKYNKNGSLRKRIIDKSNVYSVVIKYLLDTLVSNKIIKDDNDNIVKIEIIKETKYLKYEEEEYAEIIIKEI